MGAVEEITNDGRGDEAAEIADGIDEPNGRGGRGLAKENRRHGPKRGKEGVGGGSDGQTHKRKPKMRSGENRQGECNDAQNEWNCRVPAAFVGAVGMPPVE